MGISATPADARAAGRDHGFHRLRIGRVIQETADAATFVLDIPADLHEAFAYRPGQFVTFRAVVDGETLLRCYSMSSTPAVDDELQVTVKRVPGGKVSNWMIDTLHAGDPVDVTLPAGVFTFAPDGRELVTFAGGSGITPVYSLVKSALAEGAGPVRLLYANRDADSVIFAGELGGLVDRHADRLRVDHHLDADAGYLTPDDVQRFVDSTDGAEYYLCGPVAFMDLVEQTLLDRGVDPGRIHVERFAPVEPEPADDTADGIVVTIELDGRSASTDHHPGTTILQTARSAGLSPPYSCEAGSCATCMARLKEGTVTMRTNDALTEEEVAEGWILTCQSVPTSPTIHVSYGFED